MKFKSEQKISTKSVRIARSHRRSISTWSSKKAKVVVPIVLAATILAGGAYTAYSYYNNKPEKVLADALINSASDILDGSPSTSTGSISVEINSPQAVKLAVTFNTKSSEKNAAGSIAAKIDFAGKTYDLKASANAFDDGEYFFKIENLKQTLHDVATTQPGIGAYASYLDPLAAKIDNKWVKVTKNDLNNSNGVNDETVNNCSDALRNLTLTKKDKNQLKKYFQINQFVVASETRKPQSIDSESSFHYKLDFNNQATAAFAKNVINMDSFKDFKKGCGLTDNKMENIFQNKENSNVQNQKPVVELWVGKSSRRPTQFKITYDDKSFVVDFSSHVKLLAKPSKIDKPSDSLPITDLKAEFEQLMPSNTSNL